MISGQAVEGYLKEIYGADSIAMAPESPPFEWIPLIWQMSMECYEFRFFGKEFVLALILTKPTLKQLIDLDASFKSRLKVPYIFAFEADSPQIHSLLAARDINYLIPGNRIFAPKLGVAYQEMPTRPERRQQKIATRLSSVGRMVVGGIINETAPKEMRSRWERPIKYHDLLSFFPCNSFSAATFTRVFQQLQELKFGEFVGQGPQKQFQFAPRSELWEQLFVCETETVLHVSKEYSFALDQFTLPFLYTGNSALSYLGNLDEPIIPQIAVEHSEFCKWLDNSEPFVEPEQRTLVQVWRHLPIGFFGTQTLKSRCLNPIDLALTKYNTSDPREREVLSEIIRELDLDDSVIWRPHD